MASNSETLQKVASLTELFEIERKDLESTLKNLSAEKERADSLQEQLTMADSQMTAKEADFTEKMLGLKLALEEERAQCR